jgi:hypothetical protein
MDTKYFGSPQQAWMVNFRVGYRAPSITRIASGETAAELLVPTHPSDRDRCVKPKKGCETSAWPLQYRRIEVRTDDLNFGGDPRRPGLDLLFH